MSALLSLQNFNGRSVRVFGTPEYPLFIAADICQILEIANPRDAASSLDADERAAVGIADTSSNGVTQKRHVTAVTESGLYALIFKSRKPEAKEFRKWVTSEVLPTIRKTGSYSTSVPATFSEALRLAAAQAEENERLALENGKLSADVERMQPKEELFDVAMASRDTLKINEVAKILGTGERRLYRFLRNEGILRSALNAEGRAMKEHNTPYQQFIEAGYFIVTEFPYTTLNHGSKISLTTRVTQKGVQFISRRLEAATQEAA